MYLSKQYNNNNIMYMCIIKKLTLLLSVLKCILYIYVSNPQSKKNNCDGFEDLNCDLVSDTQFCVMLVYRPLLRMA